MDLSIYQSAAYVDGGRIASGENAGLDCFGLVRHALHYQFDGPLMDSFSGIFRTDHADMTSEFNNSVGAFELCSPQAGAIACCFHKTENGDVLHHVGICIDESSVMHTSEKHGYAVVPVRVFKRLSGNVEFYLFKNNCSASEKNNDGC